MRQNTSIQATTFNNDPREGQQACPEPQLVSDNAYGEELSEPENLRSEHESLKYHLLGPSLTKAGQDKVDQQKVNQPFIFLN